MTDELCINTIRCFGAELPTKANSGHPGAPMGMAPMAHLLWSKYMKHNPANPLWFNRDRFVLSNGHACALQYTMLHLAGYSEFTLDELKKFRQIDSKTPGHPENYLVKGGIEVTTGPLGQGISNAVGLAIAEKHLSATYNKPDFPVIDNKIWVFAGDGCLQEGVSSEACSLAGHLGLNNLIVLYDDNHITIDGHTDLSFSEDVGKRYESYGWHVIHVKDGNNDLKALSAAIDEAVTIKDKPILIKVHTTIGFGSKLENTHKIHGSPLPDDEIAFIKQKFGFDPKQSFFIPEDVKKIYVAAAQKGASLETKWNQLFQDYKSKFPELAAELERRISGKLPEGWEKVLPTFKPTDAAKATRQHGQTVINALAKVVPELVGGSADLNPSTLTYLDCSKDFQKKTPEGRNIRYGVREHGMAAISNGLIAYGGCIPYCSTFFNFIGYALGAVRLSAISHFGVIYVMTHDSIGLGEDGPTHQPIESVTIVRAMPNIFLIRPADGNETSGAWATALKHPHTPSVICLSRQALPNIANTSIEGVAKGAYTVAEAPEGKPQLILVGTGSELQYCSSAAAALKDIKVRVVSMPCWELFAVQSQEYKESIFPDGVPVLAVEAASSLGWAEYSHAVVGMTTFGASAPIKDVYNKFGFTTENVVKRAHELLDFYKGKTPHSLVKKPWNHVMEVYGVNSKH